MICLKRWARMLFRVLQKAGDKFFSNNCAVIVSQRELGNDEQGEIMNRLRFFAPSLADGARFQTAVTSADLFSSNPILTFGETSFQSSLALRLRRDGVFDVDYRRNPIEGWEWCRLSKYVAAGQRSSDDPQRRFQFYVARVKELNLDKCYIFGTGLSLAQAIERDWSDGYRVVCNTIVRDAELWNHINPHFIVAADAIYHFGFTEFARAFRADLAKRLAETETYFVYPDEFHEIVSRELGKFHERLIPVPQGTHVRFIVDLVNEFELPNFQNILTILLLPLACTLSKNVFMWGFDGRAPDDKLFWSNSSKHNYPELMETLLKAHPAFFKHFVPSSNPTAYVKRVHGDGLDAQLTSAEQRGWRFVMMHKSWTPTLQKRFKGDS